MKSTRETVGVALLLLAATFIVTRCFLGCASAQERAAQAFIVATYERELNACYEQGQMSNSWPVYQACANALDRRMCVERGLRCVEAGGE